MHLFSGGRWQLLLSTLQDTNVSHTGAWEREGAEHPDTPQSREKGSTLSTIAAGQLLHTHHVLPVIVHMPLPGHHQYTLKDIVFVSAGVSYTHKV